MKISKEFRFEAAHYLPRVPKEHQCSRLHGHSWRVDVTLEGPVVAEDGWVMDFGVLSALLAELREELDHRCLNEVPGLENPTSENLAIWIWDRLRPRVGLLHSVRVAETRTSSVIYRGGA